MVGYSKQEFLRSRSHKIFCFYYRGASPIFVISQNYLIAALGEQSHRHVIRLFLQELFMLRVDHPPLVIDVNLGPVMKVPGLQQRIFGNHEAADTAGRDTLRSSQRREQVHVFGAVAAFVA